MTSPTDGLKDLAEAYAEFIRRARRAPLTRRERERLVDYVRQHAHRMAPAPVHQGPETETMVSSAWQDIGYR